MSANNVVILLVAPHIYFERKKAVKEVSEFVSICGRSLETKWIWRIQVVFFISSFLVYGVLRPHSHDDDPFL